MEVRKDIGISPQSIGVGTYSAAANPMDRDFYLIVACS
jgi:hypothetical protein